MLRLFEDSYSLSLFQRQNGLKMIPKKEIAEDNSRERNSSEDWNSLR